MLRKIVKLARKSLLGPVLLVLLFASTSIVISACGSSGSGNSLTGSGK